MKKLSVLALAILACCSCARPHHLGSSLGTDGSGTPSLNRLDDSSGSPIGGSPTTVGQETTPGGVTGGGTGGTGGGTTAGNPGVIVVNGEDSNPSLTRVTLCFANSIANGTGTTDGSSASSARVEAGSLDLVTGVLSLNVTLQSAVNPRTGGFTFLKNPVFKLAQCGDGNSVTIVRNGKVLSTPEEGFTIVADGYYYFGPRLNHVVYMDFRPALDRLKSVTDGSELKGAVEGGYYSWF